MAGDQRKAEAGPLRPSVSRARTFCGDLDEPSVEVDHPKGPLELLAVGGGRKRRNGIQVLGERGDTSGGDGVTQKWLTCQRRT